MKKKVNYPIEVPYGPFCWQPMIDGNVPCEYLDMSGGTGSCKLGFPFLENTENGIIKSVICSNLKEITYDQ